MCISRAVEATVQVLPLTIKSEVSAVCIPLAGSALDTGGFKRGSHQERRGVVVEKVQISPLPREPWKLNLQQINSIQKLVIDTSD